MSYTFSDYHNKLCMWYKIICDNRGGGGGGHLTRKIHNIDLILNFPYFH